MQHAHGKHKSLFFPLRFHERGLAARGCPGCQGGAAGTGTCLVQPSPSPVGRAGGSAALRHQSLAPRRRLRKLPLFLVCLYEAFSATKLVSRSDSSDGPPKSIFSDVWGYTSCVAVGCPHVCGSPPPPPRAGDPCRVIKAGSPVLPLALATNRTSTMNKTSTAWTTLPTAPYPNRQPCSLLICLFI